MVVIEEEKCSGCGSCVKVCHEHCMALADNKVVIDHAVCSSCTQCIAICSAQALSWDGVAPLAFDPSALPSPRQMDELFRQRRTVRDFRDEPVPRGTLEEIASYGTCAPTHDFKLRCIIIDNRDIIQLFDREIFRFSQRIYGLLFRPRIMQKLVRLAPAPFQEEFARGKPKLEMARKWGRGYRSRPPALICIVGDRRVPLSLESAQYALHTMSLYAQAKGVASRNLVGNQMAFNRSRAIRERLNIGRHERIVAMMGVGEPAVRFRNKVRGKLMAVQWNEGSFRQAD
jgi:NAD-dependent dihydropyrimidine dehydrogenase PreA subunit